MKRIKVIVPVSTAMWNEPVKEEMEKYKDSDTEISIINITKGPESIECLYDEAYAELFVLQEAEKAEKEGYDAIIIYCFQDPGLRAAKEKLNIPVVGINEPSIHVATLLGNKFSIIFPGNVFNSIVDKLNLYSLEHRCASIRACGISVLDLEKNKEKTAQSLYEEAKKAVEEDGADTIVFGCGGMLGIADKISKQLKVPVIAPGFVGLKICEDLISLGLSQSKRFFATPTEKNRIS